MATLRQLKACLTTHTHNKPVFFLGVVFILLLLPSAACADVINGGFLRPLYAAIKKGLGEIIGGLALILLAGSIVIDKDVSINDLLQQREKTSCKSPPWPAGPNKK